MLGRGLVACALACVLAGLPAARTACAGDAPPAQPGPAAPPPAEPAPADPEPAEPVPGEAPAGEEQAPPDPLAAELAPLLEAVQEKAREADVRALMRHPALRETRLALAAALRLAHAGGPYAARALRTLAATEDRSVKLAALGGIGKAGLRMRGTESDDRELGRALRSEDLDLRRAAVQALGRMGLPDDVEALVAALASEDGPLRLAAEQSLALLTGTNQGRSPGRWSSWWQRNREPMARAVELALDLLEEGAEVVSEGGEGAQALGAQEEQAWSLVERDAWLLLPGASGRAREWMTHAEAQMRARGYRLAAALRSLDLVDDLRRAQRSGESEPATLATLERALKAYGMLGLEKKDR